MVKNPMNTSSIYLFIYLFIFPLYTTKALGAVQLTLCTRKRKKKKKKKQTCPPLDINWLFNSPSLRN